MSPQELKKRIIQNLQYDSSFSRVLDTINYRLTNLSYIDESPIIITLEIAFKKESHPKIIFYYKICGWSNVEIENIELEGKTISRITFYQ